MRVAVPSPLRRLFDYLPLDAQGASLPPPGSRVRVPFGRGERVGMVIAHSDHTDVAPQRLKRVSALIDPEPLLDSDNLACIASRDGVVECDVKSCCYAVFGFGGSGFRSFRYCRHRSYLQCELKGKEVAPN